MDPILIYQKDWALTSSDAERPVIKTGHFGPCYLLVLSTVKVLVEKENESLKIKGNEEKSSRKEISHLVESQTEKTLATRQFFAMAHIDDSTNVASIKDIFDEFAKFDVKPEGIKVSIVGGWKQEKSSKMWGDKILKHIRNAGCKDIDRQLVYLKIQMTEIQKKRGCRSLEALQNHFYGGAEFDARTAKLTLLKEKDEKIAAEQIKQIELFKAKYKNNLNTVELPLNRITP